MSAPQGFAPVQLAALLFGLAIISALVGWGRYKEA